MSTSTQELVRICDQLPDAKRAEVADFARFLLAREGDEQWERQLATAKSRPKLEAFLRASAGDPAIPLDTSRL